jgi:hypothetical protein
MYFEESFQTWLQQVDAHLADIEQSRDTLPYHLHQWWDMWDAHVKPLAAATAAELLKPGNTGPWPGHAAYLPKYQQAWTPDPYKFAKPIQVLCEACNAKPGEPCRPYCVGAANYIETCQGMEV